MNVSPLNQQIHDRHRVYPKEALVDGGSAQHQDIEAAHTRCGGCTVDAPVPKPRDPERDRYAPHEGDSPTVAEWHAPMATEPAKAISKQRAATAGCVNAQACNRGLIRLLVRGLTKVRAITLWYAIAHDMMCGVRLHAQAALAG